MPTDKITGKEVPLMSDPCDAASYIPANSTKNYRTLLTNLQALINALATHPSTQEALSHCGPASPPPREKQTKTYFQHDFCARSRAMILACDPELKSAQARNDFSEAYERCIFTQMLVNDKTGKLSLMTGEQPGKELDFGDEVRKAADGLNDGVDGDAILQKRVA